MKTKVGYGKDRSWHQLVGFFATFGWKTVWTIKWFLRWNPWKELKIHYIMFETWDHYFTNQKPQTCLKMERMVTICDDHMIICHQTTFELNLADSTQALLSGAKGVILWPRTQSIWAGNDELHRFTCFFCRWMNPINHGINICPTQPPPPNKKQGPVPQWMLLRNSEVHPINAQRRKKPRGSTPAIWAPPAQKTYHNTANAGEKIQIFHGEKRLSAQVHGAHHSDIRRSKLQRSQNSSCSGPSVLPANVGLPVAVQKDGPNAYAMIAVHRKHLKDSNDLGCHISSDSSRG